MHAPCMQVETWAGTLHPEHSTAWPVACPGGPHALENTQSPEWGRGASSPSHGWLLTTLLPTPPSPALRQSLPVCLLPPGEDPHPRPAIPSRPLPGAGALGTQKRPASHIFTSYFWSDSSVLNARCFKQKSPGQGLDGLFPVLTPKLVWCLGSQGVGGRGRQHR